MGVTLVLAGLVTLTPIQSAEAATWNLVWSDEFNGSGAPNSANWSYAVGNGNNGGNFDGWGNGEWEWYRPENCTQSNGNLVIKAEWLSSPMSLYGRDWYQKSCRITTDTKKSFKYGKIEARMSLPNANGAWPAFWMLGDACDESSTSSYNPSSTYADTLPTNWASCGELDIMEHKNSESNVVHNLFWDTRTGLYSWNGSTVANDPSTVASGINVSGFHTYAIEWNESSIKWLVDGNVTKTVTTSSSAMEEFRNNFHIILNLALGGSFPGMEPSQSQFPLTMSVDYVRYYTLGSGGGGGDQGGGSATSTIQAESYSAQSGTGVEATSDSGGGSNVAYISNGDWLQFNNVDFGSTALTQFKARVASGIGGGASGLVQVHLDSLSNPAIGSFSVGNTGGWQSWKTIPTNMSGTTGKHTVYLKFVSGQSADFVNVNWITFGT